MKLIPFFFKPFFERYSLKEIYSEYTNTKSYANNDIILNFVVDTRYNEISINLSKNGAKHYKTLLSVFELIMPKENKDVFAFLKNEYANLDIDLVGLKEDYSDDSNVFFLLAACSILIKYYKEIVEVIESV